jgi:hypothetical protein
VGDGEYAEGIMFVVDKENNLVILPVPRLIEEQQICAEVASVRLSTVPFRYPEVKHGKGELKYINDLPVLLVAGTAEEIGDEIGVLGMKPFSPLLGQLHETLKAWGRERAYPLLDQDRQSDGPTVPSGSAEGVRSDGQGVRR